MGKLPTDKNSTTVQSWAKDVARANWRALNAASPALVTRLAEHVFTRTRRRPAKSEEQRILLQASKGRLKQKDRTIRTWVWGSRGPTVLLVHGWNGRAGQLGGFVPELLRAGYRVIAFDGTGHGQSTGSSSSLPQLATDIAEVGWHYGPIEAVVAHSMGGLALLLALSRSELNIGRAVLIAPPAYPVRWFEMMSARLQLTARTRKQLHERLIRRFGLNLESAAGPALVKELNLRALLIHDREDRDVPLADSEDIAAAWPGAELWVTEGLGHTRILRDPGIIATAASFIAGGESREQAKTVPTLRAL